MFKKDGLTKKNVWNWKMKLLSKNSDENINSLGNTAAYTEGKIREYDLYGCLDELLCLTKVGQ